MEKEKICKEALSRETVSIPALQKEFSLTYPQARAVVEELVSNDAFRYESGVVFRRTKRGEKAFCAAEERLAEESSEGEARQTSDEACDATLEKLKKQRADLMARELRRKRAELIKKWKEEQEEGAKSEEGRTDAESERTDGERKKEKEEDGEKAESDPPFGSLRFEPNLIVAGKQMTWERLGDYSFRLRVVWLKYSSGEDCTLKVMFTDSGSTYLTDDGYVFETVSKKSGEIAARMKLSMAERSWDFIKVENETLMMETSVTHLIADAFRLYAAIDRILD